MRKLNWKKGSRHPKDRHVSFCDLYLDCCYEDEQWRPYVCLGDRNRFGVWFDSLEEAQEDCVKLARQLLIDYHEHISRIIKGFGIDCDEI